MAAINTAIPAFNHHVLVPASARTTSHSAPNSRTGPATATTFAGSSRNTVQAIANHAAPANMRKPHVLSRTSFTGAEPDHNMRPPAIVSLP